MVEMTFWALPVGWYVVIGVVAVALVAIPWRLMRAHDDIWFLLTPSLIGLPFVALIALVGGMGYAEELNVRAVEAHYGIELPDNRSIRAVTYTTHEDAVIRDEDNGTIQTVSVLLYVKDGTATLYTDRGATSEELVEFDKDDIQAANSAETQQEMPRR